MLCARQQCVDCEWCFTVEGTACYCILYILTVTTHKTYTILQVHNQTQRTLHTHTHVYPNFDVIKLPIFPLEYNTEELETSQRHPPHSFMLRREVCVTLKSPAFVCWCVREQMIDCVSLAALCCIFRQLLVNSPCPLSSAMELLQMII